jgi:hypothetical protein
VVVKAMEHINKSLQISLKIIPFVAIFYAFTETAGHTLRTFYLLIAQGLLAPLIYFSLLGIGVFDVDSGGKIFLVIRALAFSAIIFFILYPILRYRDTKLKKYLFISLITGSWTAISIIGFILYVMVFYYAGWAD